MKCILYNIMDNKHDECNHYDEYVDYLINESKWLDNIIKDLINEQPGADINTIVDLTTKKTYNRAKSIARRKKIAHVRGRRSRSANYDKYMKMSRVYKSKTKSDNKYNKKEKPRKRVRYSLVDSYEQEITKHKSRIPVYNKYLTLPSKVS